LNRSAQDSFLPEVQVKDQELTSVVFVPKEPFWKELLIL